MNTPMALKKKDPDKEPCYSHDDEDGVHGSIGAQLVV